MCTHSEYCVCTCVQYIKYVDTCVYEVLLSLCVYISMSYTLMVSPWAREPSSCTNTTSASLVTRTISSCPSASMSYCSHIRKRRKQMPSSFSLSPSLLPSPLTLTLTLTPLPPHSHSSLSPSSLTYPPPHSHPPPHSPSPSLSPLTPTLPSHSHPPLHSNTLPAASLLLPYLNSWAERV